MKSELDSIYANTPWKYAAAIDDAENSVRCPICGKPAFKRVMNEGPYASNPEINYAHTMIIRDDNGFKSAIVMEYCNTATGKDPGRQMLEAITRRKPRLG